MAWTAGMSMESGRRAAASPAPTAAGPLTPTMAGMRAPVRATTVLCAVILTHSVQCHSCDLDPLMVAACCILCAC